MTGWVSIDACVNHAGSVAYGKVVFLANFWDPVERRRVGAK